MRDSIQIDGYQYRIVLTPLRQFMHGVEWPGIVDHDRRQIRIWAGVPKHLRETALRMLTHYAVEFPPADREPMEEQPPAPVTEPPAEPRTLDITVYGQQYRIPERNWLAVIVILSMMKAGK